MDSIIFSEPTNDSASPTIIYTSFLDTLTEILSTENRCIFWNSDGKGFSFNRHHLEEWLASEAVPFEQQSVEMFICQLKQEGFSATVAESNLNDIDDDDTFLAFHRPDFMRIDTDPVVEAGPPTKPTKPFYCNTERNYLKYKRAHDPCYKPMGTTSRNPFAISKERFRAVLAQQKLKRIIDARLATPPVGGGDVFGDLLPNETNISIQMGAIAGYYGETVVEDDLIEFFGKYLPMYKPISDVVDSITPSISNKIQSSSRMWRNQSAVCDQQPTTIVTSSTATAKRNSMMKEVKAAVATTVVDPVNDITFEFVSFKDQLPLNRAQKNKSKQIIAPNAVGLVNVADQGCMPNHDKPMIISYQQRDDFLTGSSGEKLVTNGMDEGPSVGIVAPADNETMQQFSSDLLDSNYYDTSSHEFGMELKNAIDLIMN